MIATSLFDAGGPRFDLLLDRYQSHQMLGNMASKAREASWDFGELGWIDPACMWSCPRGFRCREAGGRAGRLLPRLP